MVHCFELKNFISNSQKVYRWRRLSDWYIVCLVHILPQSETPKTADPSGVPASVGPNFHAYKSPLILAAAAIRIPKRSEIFRWKHIKRPTIRWYFIA